MNGIDVQRSHSVKYLGSMLDKNLSFKKHTVNKVVCQCLICVESEIRKFLTKVACHTIVLGQVISPLDSDSALLVGLMDCDIKEFYYNMSRIWQQNWYMIQKGGGTA